MDAQNRPLERLAQLFFAAALLLTLPALGVPLGLSSEADAADYRVPLLQWIIRHHALPDWPWTPVDNYPMLGELLMLPLRALHGGLDRLVPIAAYAGIGLCAGALFRILVPKLGTHGFWTAAALTLAFRPVATQSNLLMVDNVASAFVLLAIVLALRKHDIMAGLVFGLALATRYSVWPLLPALWLFYVILGRNPSALLKLTLAALLPIIPLILRNIAQEGNPVFPLLTSLLGPSDVVVSIGWDSYGRHPLILGLLLLPFDLLFTNQIGPPLFDYTVGRSTLLLLAFIGVCALIWPDKIRAAIADLRGRPEHKALIAFSLFGMGLWYLAGPQLRFAVPQLVVMLTVCLAVFLPIAPRAMIVSLFAAGLLTLASVHKNAILLAIGKKESVFQPAADAARDQIERANLPINVAVGWRQRDGSLGFLDRDFVFVTPHPYALGDSRAPDVEWLYDPSLAPNGLTLFSIKNNQTTEHSTTAPITEK
jgi:hypothetical protein